MIGNPIGMKCVLQDTDGREMHCRVISALIRETIGCVPELDLTVGLETISESHVMPWERKITMESRIPQLIFQPPEFNYVFRYGIRYKAKKVIFNPPATVVLWEDGTKTVVKCDKEEEFNETTGIALCYMKKALGNTSRELNKALRKAMG